MVRRFKHFLFTVVSFFLFIVYPLPSMAQIWTNLGLYGGQVYDIAIDPTNPSKIFAGSYMGDGLFVTLDGGNNWKPVKMEHRFEGEDTFKNHAVWAVEIAASDSDVVWAAHNYWVAKSTDGGLTWVHIRNTAMQRVCTDCGGEADNFRFCKTLAVDPRDPLKVYVGTGGPWGAYSLGAIYKTEDGGLTWTKMNQGNDLDYEVTSVTVDPQNSAIIWAATSSQGVMGVWAGSLYRSGDGGETWDRVIALDSGFTSVAVKSDDSNSVFTGSGYGIIRHYFDGMQWQLQWPVISEDVGCRNVRAIAFDPQDPEIVYAGWKNPWFGDFLPKVSRSVDGGTNWETYVVDYQFFALAVSPTNSDEVYGGDIGLGVFRSGNHGQAWTPMNNGINAVIVYNVATNPGESGHILAATISGVYEKKTGKDWSRLLAYGARSLEFDPVDSRIIYAGLEGYVAKTIDAGLLWSYSKVSDETQNIYDIRINPVDTDVLYFAVDLYGQGGAVFKSEDGGSSFSKVLDGINLLGQPYAFNAVAIDPADPLRILAGGGNFYAPRADGDLWESMDGGVTWDRNSLSNLNVIVNALLIDPRNPKTIYAGCGYSADTSVPIYRSSDGGKTWTSSFHGIPSERKILHGVWGDSSTDIFTVGWSGSILRYDGDNWAEMVSGTTEHLEGIWGSSSSSVFVVGASGTILYYDADIWVEMSSGTTEYLHDIWGSSPSTVFAVGAKGTILHHDGNDWVPMNSGTTEDLYDIWGSSSASVFVVGAGGKILHYDGNDWIPMNSGTTRDLWGIWGNSAVSVFAVGENGTILHYDGNNWVSMISGISLGLNAIWGTSFSDVYSAGEMASVFHFNGKEWSNIGAFGTREWLQDIWGNSNRDIIVVGESGSIQRFDGIQWTSMRDPGAKGNAVTDLKFHRKDPNTLYASTHGAGIYVSPNQAKKWLSLEAPDYSVFALSAGSLYAACEGGLWQCTGTGVIAGQVTDDATAGNIHEAIVFNDLGVKTLTVNGEYMMVTPVGTFSVTAVKDGYANKSAGNVTVYGGDVSWADMSMEAGVSDPTAVGLTGGGDIGGGG